MAGTNKNILTYTQLCSSINPSFWSKLTELKLNVDKLDENSRHIWGYFYNLNNDCPAPILEVDSTSFNSNFDQQNMYIPFHGKIFNKNTIEQFKEMDKTILINEEGQKIMEKIKNEQVLHDPSLLNSFIILSFADLKKYHYYYWFAFPVPSGIAVTNTSAVPITEKFSQDQFTTIYNEYKSLEAAQKPYFLIENTNSDIKIHRLNAKIKELTLDNHNAFYFAFYDVSYKNAVPGTQLRNYIALILHHCPFLHGKTKEFIAFHLNREGSEITCTNSLVYTLELPENDLGDTTCTWVGWEKNERGKMGPRLANMKNTLDPIVLAENAVDLNLKLMKWRLLPTIDLEKVKSTKCLLLGSGTLGCSVARTLLAWGVRNISFVDNSNVSFSNPVRQTLFTYQDSVEMKAKSQAAADNLKRIFPNVNSKAYQLSIPMPGHSVGDILMEQTQENIRQLVELIMEHDVIFLLMDSRESRWLPTLLGNVYNKIVINAALGFDTYLVMRHGANTIANNVCPSLDDPKGFKIIRGQDLGCYFCNDITAPGNSMRDRTLDQQCTVTRPGVSQIAGALAVELAVSLLQHKDGASAPAFYKVDQDAELDLVAETQSVLGLLPHSIRGFLSSFDQILPATQKYKQCIACSDIILNEYKLKGNEFLLEVFNSSKYLEDLTGLTKILREVDVCDVWDSFSDDDDDNM